MNDTRKTKSDLIQEIEALRAKVARFDTTLAKLSEVEAKFKALKDMWHCVAENAPDFILTLDQKGIIQYVNRIVPPMTLDDVIGRSVYDLIRPEDHTTVRECIEQTFRTGEVTTCESRGTGDMASSWYVDRISAVKQNGKVVAATLISTDIGELKRAQESERELQAKWRSLAENVPDFIMTLDRSGTILFINRTYPGVTQDQIIGRNICEFLAPEYHQIAKESIEKTFATGRSTNFQSRGPKGIDPSWFSMRIGAVRQDESVIALTAIGTNIDALKRTQETLRDLSRQVVRAQETERRRVAGELHEQIGQTLTEIRYMLNVDPSQHAQTHLLRIAEAQDMLDKVLTQINSLSLDLRPPMLDDRGLLQALLWHISRYTSQTGVQVSFLHEGLRERFPAEVETAAFRIIQEALANVARHAKVDKATVDIRRTEDGDLMIEIRDAGIGFDPDAAFESGTAVGLVGMGERALSVGGDVAIHSAPGRGTTIRARIPLPSPPAASRQKEPRTDD